MDTCLWHNKTVNANEIKNDFIMETEIRLASSRKELICPDSDCGAAMIYCHGEIKETPYFAHVNKNKSCNYSEYDRTNSTNIKNAKIKIYDHFKNLGFNIKMDVKLIEHHYTHLAITSDDYKIIAIELKNKTATASVIEKLSKIYMDKNLLVKWIVIDNNENLHSENQTYYIKRKQLNDSINKNLLVINSDVTEIKQYKNGPDNNLFYFIQELNQLTILNNDIVLLGFDQAFEKWVNQIQLKKIWQIKSLTEKNNTLKSSNKIYGPWDEAKFIKCIKCAVDNNNGYINILIKKIMECDDRELNIFLLLYKKVVDAEQKPKTIMCKNIMKYILEKANKPDPFNS